MNEEVARSGPAYRMLPDLLFSDNGLSTLAMRVYVLVDRLVGDTDIESVPEHLSAVMGGVSRRTVDRALKELVDAGWVTSIRPGGNQPNVWLVNPENGLDKSVTDWTNLSTPNESENAPTPSTKRSTKKEPCEPDAKVEWDPEVLRLCELLADLYHGNGNTRPNPNQDRWRIECRRLLTIDGPDGSGWTPRQIETIMRWALADSFWMGNIRSIPKLRTQFDALRAARNRELQQKESRAQREATSTTESDWMSRTTDEVPE